MGKVIQFGNRKKAKDVSNPASTQTDFGSELIHAQRRISKFGVFNEESFEEAKKNKLFIKALRTYDQLISSYVSQEESARSVATLRNNDAKLLRNYYLEWIKDLNSLTDAECLEINSCCTPKETKRSLGLFRLMSSIDD